MSLITLKNTGSQEPYTFRNHFRAPLELPPHSSVSLVSAIVYKGEELDVTGNDSWYSMIGNTSDGNAPLNPTQQHILEPQGQQYFTPTQLSTAMTDNMRQNTGQPAFMGHTTPGANEAWSVVWNSVTNKMKISQVSEPTPVEGATDLALYPWSGDGTLYTTTITGDYINLFRTANAAANANERTIGTTYLNPVSGTHSGTIPRSGGHIIFQPQKNPVTGEYDPNTFFGLGQTSPQMSSLASFQTDTTATFGTYYIELYGAGGATPSRARVMLNEGNPSTDVTIEPAVQQGAFQPIPGVVGQVYTYAFEWNSPYSMLIKYSIDYNATLADPYGSATWTTWVDGTTTGSETWIPTFNDNYAPMVSIDRRGDMKIRGTFSHQAGTWDYIEQGLGEEFGVNSCFDCQTGVLASTDTLTGVYPNQRLKKEVKILTDTSLVAGFNAVQRDNWDECIILWYETALAKLLGFGSNFQQVLIEDPLLTPYVASYQGTDIVTNSKILPTIHIQLTNFGIESKNGVVSNNVKDIGIIPQFGNTENSNSNTQLHFESAYENRINLNNLQTININQIDCLVTYDDNTQARVLENTSTFIVKFHLGKED